MGREENETNTQTTPPPPPLWGSFEELLLACAVSRYGNESWDLIAIEIQNRTLLSFTPQNCIDKFNQLERRFSSQNDAADLSYLVDQLTRIRVAELRDDVQRRDVSIVSLEMKVKRLEEERERSLKADLKRQMLSPEIFAGKSVAGDDDGDRSFNESNSTSQKGELVMEMKKKEKKNTNPRNDAVEREDEEIRNEPDFKNKPNPVWLGSDPVQTGSDSVRVRDLLSNSKLEGKNVQSSDVQSSASLSKMKRRRIRGVGVGGAGGVSSGEEEAEGDEVSPAMKRVSVVESEPLVQFLEIIRSHRLGWAFQRRLRSQESERYKKLIRQHMDVRTIQSKLNKGAYDCIQNFFRDLLLIFNNAIIFYKKPSQEHLAAQELRAIVLKEMKPPQPNKSPTMVACGKRSSIKAISENASKKREKKERDVDEKPKVSEKKIEGSIVSLEEKGINKNRSKERPVSGRRNTRTSNKSVEIKHEYGGNELSSHDSLEVKIDMRETRAKKRQGAVSFLKRMKQNSPSDVVDSKDDVSEDESGEDKGEKQKNGRGRKSEAVTDRVTRSSRGRGAREESGKVRRSVGRPPKRQAAPESTGKRGRDNGENEVVGGGGRPRKRSRR